MRFGPGRDLRLARRDRYVHVLFYDGRLSRDRPIPGKGELFNLPGDGGFAEMASRCVGCAGAGL